MSTIFKKIIDKEIPANIVYEDEDFLAFHDINPQAKVHVLVIPKKEIRNLDAATEEDALLLGRLQLVIAKIARELGIAEEGYRVITNIRTRSVPYSLSYFRWRKIASYIKIRINCSDGLIIFKWERNL